MQALGAGAGVRALVPAECQILKHEKHQKVGTECSRTRIGAFFHTNDDHNLIASVPQSDKTARMRSSACFGCHRPSIRCRSVNHNISPVDHQSLPCNGQPPFANRQPPPRNG